MQALFHSEVDVNISSGTFDNCYDYVFQLEQFSDTISVEHEVPPLSFVVVTLFYRIQVSDAPLF